MTCLIQLLAQLFECYVLPLTQSLRAFCRRDRRELMCRHTEQTTSVYFARCRMPQQGRTQLSDCEVGMQMAVDLCVTLLFTVALISKVSYGARQVEIPVHPRHTAHLQPTTHLGTSGTDTCCMRTWTKGFSLNVFVDRICLRHHHMLCSSCWPGFNMQHSP